MSKDIAKQKWSDYIPEDGHLCCNCILFNKCPFDYVCKSLKRLQEYEEEHGEL